MRILVAGSDGLVGSAVASYFERTGQEVVGVDNRPPRKLVALQDAGDRQELISADGSRRRNHQVDIRSREAVQELFERECPDVVINCAAHRAPITGDPMPFDYFDVNTMGTLNLVEATRRMEADALFIHVSSKEVYGNAVNEIPLVEMPTRWDYALPEHSAGIDERMRIDHCSHSLQGACKLAADVLVQEYGRQFGMPIVCLRCGSLSAAGAGDSEHAGFLPRLVRSACLEREVQVDGHKGKQVEDQLHPSDLCALLSDIVRQPPSLPVLNVGGGRANSVSMMEAVDTIERRAQLRMRVEYKASAPEDQQICYISDNRRLLAEYPNWRVEVHLDEIIDELVAAELANAGRAV